MSDPYVQYNSFSERNKTLLFQLTTQFLFIQQFKMVVMTIQAKLTLWYPQNYGESLKQSYRVTYHRTFILGKCSRKKTRLFITRGSNHEEELILKKAQDHKYKSREEKIVRCDIF